MELVRNHGIQPLNRDFNRDLQVDSSHDKEDTSGGSILDKDDSTKDLDTDQPEDHYIDRLLVSLVRNSCEDFKYTTD